MVDLHKIYEDLFIDLKKYIEEKSEYDSDLVNKLPNKIDASLKFPLISCEKGTFSYDSNLKEQNGFYDYNLMIINIFTKALNFSCYSSSPIRIYRELEKTIKNFFEKDDRIDIYVASNSKYINDDIFRNVIFVNYKLNEKTKKTNATTNSN